MNRERWQQIIRVFDQAVSRSPADLNAYLDQACAGDADLRREVESCLAHHREEGFLENRTGKLAAIAAEFLDHNAPELLPGARVAAYLIEAFQGRGGMGTVYRARDEKLQRQVAIKVLAPGIFLDADARRRFLTEARALAQISHPNIVTVYDVDRSDDIDFIAMEWVDGRRLDRLISNGGLRPDDALKYAVQIADALAQAHAKGVIHRDLKPSNIMITAAGSVKVFDFGLAKFAGKMEPEESNEADTTITAPGRIVGTVAYMSPEQAQGKQVDLRSDIFSFGTLLYEMLSGQHPFTGDSVIATIAAIIKEEPKPLSDRFPIQLRTVVERCLRKDPERRFQAIADVKVELEEIVQGRSPAKPDGSISRASKNLAFAALFLAVAALVGFLAWRYWVETPASSRLPDFEVSQITSSATWEGEPEISPDGSRIAFSSNASGNLDIYVTDVHGRGQQQITADPAEDSRPVWFPDSSALAFVSNRTGRASIWKTGALGGGAILLIEDAIDPAISPDQTKIAFARVSPSGYRIAVAPLDNLTEIRTLTDSPDEPVIAGNPAWSPDGNRICYVDRQDLWIIDTSGGRPKRITSDGLFKDEPAWSPDGRRIYYSSFVGGARALWRIQPSGGVSERVTDGTGYESHPSVSRDGRRLAYATDSTERGIAIVDRHSGAKNLIPGRQWFMPSISRDGTRVVFIFIRSSSYSNIWVQQLANGKPVGAPGFLAGQDDGALTYPAISPDGQWIVCYRILRNRREIMNVPSSGGHVIQLTNDPPASVTPSWSPDGSMIAFATMISTGSEICTTQVANGRPIGKSRKVAASDTFAYDPVWSPDGATLAYVESRGYAGDVWTAPSDGRAPARQITKGANAKRVRWDAGTGDLLVSGNWGKEKVIVRRVSAATGVSSPFLPEVDFGGGHASGLFDVSADGKYLVHSKEDMAGHVWMLKATKGVF